MEIIVPFQPVGRYFAEGAKTVSDMVIAMSDLLGGDLPEGFTDWWEGVFSTSLSMTKVLKQSSEFASKLPNMDGSSLINVNSLEAMAGSCRSLCMKTWTGFDYKYVIITGIQSY